MERETTENKTRMKTTISLECFDDNFLESLYEVKAIMSAAKIVSTELKVKSREKPGEHYYVQVTEHSNPLDVVELYRYKKQQREQAGLQAICDDIKRILYCDEYDQTQKLNLILKFFPLR